MDSEVNDERAANAINQIFAVRAPWPPIAHATRLENYALNQSLFEGKHTEVFTKLNKIFNDNDAEHQKLVLVFNFHKRLSTLWADLTFGEEPIVRIEDETKKIAWKRFAEETNRLWQTCYQAVIDLSRFGDCVFRLWYDEKKGTRIEAVSPQKWFPITDPFSDDPLAHVIAYTVDVWDDHIKTTYLKAEIHTPGKIENRIYVLKDSKLMLEVDPGEFGIEATIDTGVDEMLIIPLSNDNTTTDGTGNDDYKPLDSIIESLEMRYTRLARIFDYHSEPDKGVPETAFELDNVGQTRYDPNRKIWPMYPETPLPQYITWAEGGVMSAAFTQIDKLMEVLYMVSETCKAAFAIDQTGGALSGTALRLLMTIPLKKAQRIGSLIYPIVPRLVRLGTSLEVERKFPKAVLIDDFQFTPQDGLPNDKTETINNMATLKNAGLVTRRRALQEVFDLDDHDLEEEVKQLEKEIEDSKPPMLLQQKGAADREAADNNAKLAKRGNNDGGNTAEA